MTTDNEQKRDDQIWNKVVAAEVKADAQHVKDLLAGLDDLIEVARRLDDSHITYANKSPIFSDIEARLLEAHWDVLEECRRNHPAILEAIQW